MRTVLLIPLLALTLIGCSNSTSSVGAGTGGYGSHYGAHPWWYDDYFYYWDHYYPWCCDSEGDFDELIKKWWNGLDEERQQEIKEKLQDWQESGGRPDVAALRGDFATRWNALTPEQKQTLWDNRLNRPSVSNPDRSPRSPLDYRGDARPGVDNGMLAPSTLPKIDTGGLTPAPQPVPAVPGNGTFTPAPQPVPTIPGNGTLTPAPQPVPAVPGNGMLAPSQRPASGDGTLTPAQLPKADQGLYRPSQPPKASTGVRPHLPRAMVNPPARPVIRPGVMPMRGFGIRR